MNVRLEREESIVLMALLMLEEQADKSDITRVGYSTDMVYAVASIQMPEEETGRYPVILDALEIAGLIRSIRGEEETLFALQPETKLALQRRTEASRYRKSLREEVQDREEIRF